MKMKLFQARLIFFDENKTLGCQLDYNASRISNNIKLSGAIGMLSIVKPEVVSKAHLLPDIFKCQALGCFKSSGCDWNLRNLLFKLVVKWMSSSKFRLM